VVKSAIEDDLMAVTNRDRVGKALDLLAGGLRPFVERELKAALGDRWESPARNNQRSAAVKINWDDPQVLLGVMLDQWQPVFGNALGRNDRNLMHELQTVRNAWAHKEQFTSNDAIRALDSVERLLTAVTAPEPAAEAGQMRMDLMRKQPFPRVHLLLTTSDGRMAAFTTPSEIPIRASELNPDGTIKVGETVRLKSVLNNWDFLGAASEQYTAGKLILSRPGKYTLRAVYYDYPPLDLQKYPFSPPPRTVSPSVVQSPPVTVTIVAKDVKPAPKKTSAADPPVSATERPGTAQRVTHRVPPQSNLDERSVRVVCRGCCAPSTTVKYGTKTVES